MAKRMTDTDKWKKSFMRGLEGKYKLLWLYIMDDCNHAGIWDVDLDVASLRLGFEYQEEEIIKAFGEDLQVINGGSQWFFREFINSQYGKLNPGNKVHASAIKLLEVAGISVELELTENEKIEGHSSPLQGAKDKAKDKGKETKGDARGKLSEFGGLGIPEIEEALSGTEWLEKLLMRFHSFKNISLSLEDGRFKIREFVSLASDNPEEYCYPNNREAQKHFENWLKYNYQVKKQKQEIEANLMEGMTASQKNYFKKMGLDVFGAKKNQA